MKLRNWIEFAIGKRLSFTPSWSGAWKNGRKVYYLDFEDGTEGDYYIDFDRKTVEEV